MRRIVHRYLLRPTIAHRPSISTLPGLPHEPALRVEELDPLPHMVGHGDLAGRPARDGAGDLELPVGGALPAPLPEWLPNPSAARKPEVVIRLLCSRVRVFRVSVQVFLCSRVACH